MNGLTMMKICSRGAKVILTYRATIRLMNGPVHDDVGWIYQREKKTLAGALSYVSISHSIKNERRNKIVLFLQKWHAMMVAVCT